MKENELKTIEKKRKTNKMSKIKKNHIKIIVIIITIKIIMKTTLIMVKYEIKIQKTAVA